MSCGNPHLPDVDSPHRTPGPGKILLIVALVAVPTVCLCLGAGTLVWWKMAAQRELAPPDDLLPEVPEPPDALDDYFADAAAAYNSDSIGIDVAELKPIKRLFDAIIVATAAADKNAFVEQVDVDGFIRRVNSSSAMPAPGIPEDPSGKGLVHQAIAIPGPWDRYRIVQVRLDATGKAAVVHTLFRDAADGEYKVRWWIAKSPRGWKAYDWHRLEDGLRASREMAIYHAYGDSPALQEYIDCINAVDAAYGLIAENNPDEAARLLRSAEKINPPPPLRDETWLTIGNAWGRCGRIPEAMACFRRVADPDALPGALYGLAVCNAAWGRYEKALGFIARCEQRLGRSEATTWDKAEYLLALRRDTEAVVALRSLLDADPDQPDLLESLGVALPEGQKSILIDYVNRCDDPVATGSELADVFFYYDIEPAALAAVVRLLDGHDPTPATRAQLQARIKELDGDLPGACAMLQEAIAQEPEPDRRRAYANRYIGLMLSAGPPVAAYLGSPDRAAAFAYLVDACLDDLYDFSDENLTALIDQRRLDQPDDLGLFCLEGVLLTKRKSYDEADVQFAAVMAATADKGRLSAIRYARVHALHLAGKDLEAYRDVAPAQATFRQLAGYYARSPELDAARTATLKALVAAHRAAVPGDPWLFYYAGIAMENEGNYDAADQFFARGQQTTASQDTDGDDMEHDAESRREAYRVRRLQSRLRSGKILSALDEVPPASETFAFLAQRLSAERKWDQLESLIDTYRRTDPDSPELLRREVELLWQRQDYAGVVGVLGPRSMALGADHYDWEAGRLRERLVRSYLRQGQTTEAQSVAEAMYDRGDSLPLILVAAAQRDVGRTTGLVSELFPAQNLSTTVFYDEDVGPIVRGDDFLPLRQACPPDVRRDLSGASVVLLLAQPRPSDAESLGTAAGALAAPPGGDLAITRLGGEPSPGETDGFVVRDGDRTYVVAFGADRYESGEPDEQGVLGATSRRALEEHHGWLAIHASVFNQRQDDQLAAVCRLAAGLLGDDCLAVYFPGDGRLLSVEPSTRDVLAAVAAPEDLTALGDKIWLWRDAPADPAAEQLANDRRRQLTRFSAAFAARQPGQEFLVQIRLHLGPLSEPQWVAVRQIIRSNRRGKQFLAALVDDSLLAPNFHAGEPVCVESFDVTDWRYPEPQ